MSGRENPTRDELLAMAYADDELDPDARIEFEKRMGSEAALRREVAELKKLAVIARQAAPREPIDDEWDRLDRGLVHRGGLSLGFLALFTGVVGLAAWLGWQLATSELQPAVKVLVFLPIGGLVLIFLLVLRARLRTMPYDPYTEVKR